MFRRFSCGCPKIDCLQGDAMMMEPQAEGYHGSRQTGDGALAAHPLRHHFSVVTARGLMFEAGNFARLLSRVTAGLTA